MKDLWKDREFSPMLLKEVDKPFNSKEHIFEVKFDGIRAVIFVNRNSIYVQSRNKNDLTKFIRWGDITISRWKTII